MPVSPAIPPPAAWRGSIGRCREGTDAVILELGANDMLRGIKPQVTRGALDTILQRLNERHIAVLLCGMRAAPNLGADYRRSFETHLSRACGQIWRAALSVLPRRRCRRPRPLQHDGLHPTAAGVEVIVAAILPKVEELIGALVRERHPS